MSFLFIFTCNYWAEIGVKKFNSVNCKDLIDFIQWFMSWTASNLADRQELWKAAWNERLLQAEGSRNKTDILGQKNKLIITGYFPLGAGKGLLVD